MVQMSQYVLDDFLRTPRFAVFATNRADGPPQLTTIWFFYEQRYFYFYIDRGTIKYRNIVKDPRIAACITVNFVTSSEMLTVPSSFTVFPAYLQPSSLLCSLSLHQILSNTHNNEATQTSYPSLSCYSTYSF